MHSFVVWKVAYREEVFKVNYGLTFLSCIQIVFFVFNDKLLLLFDVFLFVFLRHTGMKLRCPLVSASIGLCLKACNSKSSLLLRPFHMSFGLYLVLVTPYCVELVDLLLELHC